MARLGDHVEILSGFAFDSDGFAASGDMPVVRIRDVVPGSSTTYYSGDFDPRYVVDDGDVLVGMDGNFNRGVWAGGPALLNQRVCRVRSFPQTLDERYLFHYLPTVLKRIEDDTPFATVKHLSVKTIREIDIPLPPLPEQRRIASILDETDMLRRSNREAIGLTDRMIGFAFQSLFDLSGTPSKPLAEVAMFFAGNSLPDGEPFEGQPGGVLHMKVSDMNRPGNERDVSSAAHWSSQLGSRAATAPAGSVVLPKRGGAIGTNKKRLLSRPAVLDPNLMGIAPRPEALTSQYLLAWFEQLDLGTLTTGSSVPQLNKQDLAPLRIPTPSLDLQAQFESLAHQNSELRTFLELRQAKLDELFASLQYRAFRGDL